MTSAPDTLQATQVAVPPAAPTGAGQDEGYAAEYATAILQRGRVPMPPHGFTPNWADRPRRWKHYHGAERIPLPAGQCGATATVDAGLFGGDSGTAFDLDLLGGMLLDSYGLIGRRLGIQANADLLALPKYAQANWSRGTASGGGLYPVTIYLVSGASGPLTPGVYHYSPPHHALQQLMTGNVAADLRAALRPDPDWPDTDHYLVVGVKYWQNAFKYNSFCFHAVSMDVGAALQTWRMWAQAHGAPVRPCLWFDEAEVAGLLGIQLDDEGIFAVLPLSWPSPSEPDPAVVPQPFLSPDASAGAPAVVRRTESEASHRVVRFEAVSRMQRATAAAAADRPTVTAVRLAVGRPRSGEPESVLLPPPVELTATLRRALRDRRSSFGRFRADRSLSARQLSAAIGAAAAGALDTDAATDEQAPLVRFYVFVNHVDGVEPGAYEYDAAHRALRSIHPGAPGRFLQSNYFLANYNLEQAAAVIVPTIRVHALLDAIGERAYRLVNANIGAVAQATYTAASAMGIGCGVALGFDNVSYVEELGLGPTGEAPLLIMMIGHDARADANFRFEIAPGGSR